MMVLVSVERMLALTPLPRPVGQYSDGGVLRAQDLHLIAAELLVVFVDALKRGVNMYFHDSASPLKMKSFCLV